MNGEKCQPQMSIAPHHELVGDDSPSCHTYSTLDELRHSYSQLLTSSP